MKNGAHQRINITLPGQTLERIDSIAEKGDRSRLIDTAVNFYIGHRSRAQLHAELRDGAIARASRDLEIVKLFDFTEAWEN